MNKSKTRLYRIWLNMRARCTNPKHPDYKNYGERGISVCQEWMQHFESFEDWAYSAGYREYLTIDRVDNNGGYSPDNCRWTTREIQSINRRKPLYEIDGIQKTASEWAAIAGISRALFADRWAEGKRGQELLKPLRKAKN